MCNSVDQCSNLTLCGLSCLIGSWGCKAQKESRLPKIATLKNYFIDEFEKFNNIPHQFTGA